MPLCYMVSLFLRVAFWLTPKTLPTTGPSPGSGRPDPRPPSAAADWPVCPWSGTCRWCASDRPPCGAGWWHGRRSAGSRAWRRRARPPGSSPRNCHAQKSYMSGHGVGRNKREEKRENKKPRQLLCLVLEAPRETERKMVKSETKR